VVNKPTWFEEMNHFMMCQKKRCLASRYKDAPYQLLDKDNHQEAS